MKSWSKAIALADLNIEIADTFLSRLRGLLGRRDLSEKQALLLVPCSDVHTAFMRFSIDVVFINYDGVITKIVHDLRPWRMAVDRTAFASVELKNGAAHYYQLEIGQSLLCSNTL
ncbi:DUF192 domain-containing protein [Undibacterium sp. Dicai25W]|uniref:DUF192 domain-containing protein n=1 Tax=Undibacterium sp. Dicai25W TaxID=3413034 RepID=UPI003BEF60E6